MMASVSTLSNPRIRSGRIYFATFPEHPTSISTLRNILLTRGSRPPGEVRPMDDPVIIEGEAFKVWLPIDEFNRPKGNRDLVT